MIEHVWSVLCKNSVIDKITKNISLFEVIEAIQVPWSGMPSVSLTPMEIVSLWTRDATNAPTRGQSRIYVTNPSGRHGLHQAQEIDLREYRRVRARYVISALHIEGAGIYTFSVERRADENADWEPVARIPVEIVQTAART